MVRQIGCEPAAKRALRRQGRSRSAVAVAGPDHHIGRVTAQQPQHRQQQCLVVLQVAVHHRNILRLACENAFQAGARQAASSDPAHAADTGICGRDPLRCLRGAIGGIVIDDDELPSHIRQSGLEHVDEQRNVVPLIEGRNDDAELGSRLR